MCEHFGRCGGCTYLDIPYEEELKIKEAALKETLGEYAGFYKNLIPSPKQNEYRNKMELSFGDEGKDGVLALGMRKKRSFYEVATPLNCVLICDDFKKIINTVLEYFRESGDAFFHRKRHTGSLRHLVLRRGEFTGEILLNLSTTSSLSTPLKPLIEKLNSINLDGKLVGFLQSINDGVADAVKNENVSLLWGRDHYFEEISGLRFKVHAFAFFQTNSAGAEVLYKKVCEANFSQPAVNTETKGFGRKMRSSFLAHEKVKSYAGNGKTVYDLYCGTGTISQIVSPLFEKVIGIEIVEDAIISAKDNTKLNKITNCEFYAGNVMDILKQIKSPPEVVIVDPPRDGLHPKALLQIIALNTPKLVYVACKPKSLVRDLDLLTKQGYKLEKIVAVDMFPKTPHVECVAELKRV